MNNDGPTYAKRSRNYYMRRLARPRLAIATLLLTAASDRPASAAPIVTSGDASISHNSPTWSIAAGGATLTLALDPGRDFGVLGLVTSSNTPWTIGALPDTTITIAGRTLPFGNRSAGFTLQSADAHAVDNGLQLDAVFDLSRASLRLTRHYRVTPGSPTFETWTTYVAVGGRPAIANLNVLQLSLPAGAIRWLTGLRGDNADVEHDTAFTLNRRDLAAGGQFAIGATARSSERAVPWMAIDGTKDEFFAALMWSGAWSLTANRVANQLAMSFRLAGMTTTLDPGSPGGNGTVDGPHALFGVVPGGIDQASAALRSYVINGLRGGRALASLVTYNTWFTYGTDFDDEAMRAEMTNAAALGVELFVIDAGWYAGAGAGGTFDFDAGLGSWIADPARFPGGLKPLTDFAHSLGMKFGLWVEPERINQSLIGVNDVPGTADLGNIDEAWLATTGGAYESDHAAQICLASPAARDWLAGQLTALIDEVQPDYLKWDNNMFINCDRAGHGHGTADGNFAHVNGLYSLLAALRDRYPEMLIENVSGGGNRLDLGMLRYTDVAWMDDRSAPSVHVRHNVQGLSAVFPPAYLLSFLVDDESESLHDSPDLPLYARSRMEGALGLCFRSGDLSESDATALSREIDIYKSIRGTLGAAAGTLLTRQALAQNGPAWDVLQETSADKQQLVLCAVQSDQGVLKFTVKPKGLEAGTTYDVSSVDNGPLGSATGADLMSHGIDVVASPDSAAHLLVVTARQP
jgi:alpha-galactosidase